MGEQDLQDELRWQRIEARRREAMKRVDVAFAGVVHRE